MEDNGRYEMMTCTMEGNLGAKWESKSQKQQTGFHLCQLCIDSILVQTYISAKTNVFSKKWYSPRDVQFCRAIVAFSFGAEILTKKPHNNYLIGTIVTHY